MFEKNHSIDKKYIFYSMIVIGWLISYSTSAIAIPINPISSQTIPGEIINSPNIFNQQNGILPLNNDLLSTLTIQSCINGCLFFNAKNTSSSFIGNSTEIAIGSVWQLGITVPKRENCTLRLKAFRRKHFRTTYSTSPVTDVTCQN